MFKATCALLKTDMTSDDNKYKDFYEKYRHSIWDACFRASPKDADRCADLIQEVCIHLWLHFEEKPEDKLGEKRWLRNTVKRFLSSAKERRAVSTVAIDSVGELADAGSVFAERELFDDMVYQLSLEERWLLTQVVYGYTVAEIAEGHHITQSTVYKRLNAMKRKISLKTKKS